MQITPTLCVCLTSVATLLGATGDSNFDTSPTTVVAYIDGKQVTRSDFEGKNTERLFQAQNAYYQAERRVLDQFIGQYLLEQQAARENITVDGLLDRHVKSKLAKDPSEEALQVYYEGLDVNQPFQAVREQIIAHVRQRRFEKAKAEYVQSLRDQRNVIVALSPPKADIELADTPVRGVSNAPVTVVEFADYECPYCQQVDSVLKRLESEYQGRVAFAFKDSPLPSHPHAEKAAEAAHCAAVQGKFWEYHDVLFATKQYEAADLKQHARKLNLETTAFDKCLDTGEQAQAVKAQLAQAEKFGLSGTPSFFVNGRFLSGAVDYATLRGVVEQELTASEHSKIPPVSARQTNPRPAMPDLLPPN